jgi:hypothetical protein
MYFNSINSSCFLFYFIFGKISIIYVSTNLIEFFVLCFCSFMLTINFCFRSFYQFSHCILPFNFKQVPILRVHQSFHIYHGYHRSILWGWHFYLYLLIIKGKLLILTFIFQISSIRSKNWWNLQFIISFIVLIYFLMSILRNTSLNIPIFNHVLLWKNFIGHFKSVLLTVLLILLESFNM